MLIDHYILVGQTPVPIDCDPYTEEGQARLTEWALEFEKTDRRVAETYSWFKLCRVSTVFLGLDHNWARVAMGDETLPPLLFESMAFWYVKGGMCSDQQERCSTWLEAEAQHKRMLRECRVPWNAARYLWAAWRDRKRPKLQF